jgi:tyrosyl-tRNA synthetase
MLTFMELEEIEQYEEEMASASYVPNTAQKRLAEEVTRLVHGEQGLQAALKATQGMAPGAETALDASTLESLGADVPTCALARHDVVGTKYIDLLVKAGLQPSKGQARRLVEGGGAYLNNIKIASVEHTINPSDLIDNRLLLLAVGKKNKLVVKVEG